MHIKYLFNMLMCGLGMLHGLWLCDHAAVC